jgi:UDP-N-acetyl-D-galactosamine dehydrogenase
LTHKAEMIGYHPEVILAGRRINDNMGKFVAEQTVKRIINAGSPVRGAKVNVLGFTFKENVPDLRNSRVIDVIQELKSYKVDVFVHDPVASPADAHEEYGIELCSWEQLPVADALIMAVVHDEFIRRNVADYRSKLVRNGCFVDVKARFDPAALSDAELSVWRL